MQAFLFLFPSQKQLLAPSSLDKLKKYVQTKNITLGGTHLFKSGKGVRIACDTTKDIIALQKEIEVHFHDDQIDVALLEKDLVGSCKLLLSDMDSTVIEQECIDELADFVGKKEEISKITEKAMQGNIDFSTSLIQRVAFLKGVSIEVAQSCFEEKITLTHGAKELFSYIHETTNIKTALVSGGFLLFAKQVGKSLGIENIFANQLITQKDILLGQVSSPIIDSHRKKTILETFMRDHSFERSETIAVGDGANDIPMLEASGVGIAFHAKPIVQETARVRLNFASLEVIKYFLMDL